MLIRVFFPLFVCTLLVSLLGAAVAAPNLIDSTRVNKAVALMGQFNFKDAYLVFEELTLQSPDNNELRINLAIALFNRQLKGDEGDALKILQQVLEKEPQNLRARYCIGLLLLHKGELQNGLNHFIALLQHKPKDADLLYFTGKTLMQLNLYEDALDFYEKALVQDPYLLSGYYSRIISLRQLGRQEEALQTIEAYKAMKNNPRSRTAAFKYSKMGRLAEVVTLDGLQKQPLSLPPGSLFEKPRRLYLGQHPSSSLVDRKSSDITLADINGDGYLDVFVPAVSHTAQNNILLGVADSSSFTPAADHPFSKIEGVNSALWGDINDDGLTDVYFLCRGKNHLFLQVKEKKENTWREVTQESGTAGKPLNSTAGALFDADHDGDLDIYTVNLDGPNELFNNNRNGTFRLLGEEKTLAGNVGSTAIVVQDIDQDRDADILVINIYPPHHVYINDRLWNYRQSQEQNHFANQDIVSITAGDADADGRIELYTVNSSGQLFQWTTGDRTLAATEILHLNKPLNWKNSRLQLADCNGDGKLELLLTHANIFSVYSLDGVRVEEIYNEELPANILSAAVLHTQQGPSVLLQDESGVLQLLAPGPGRFKFSLVQATGRKEKEANLRTNTSGIGTSLLVRIGSRWTAQDTFFNDMNRGQSFQPLAVGLGGHRLIDFIQLHWPDGVFQTEMALLPDARHVISETQRQMSSCPVLFAWNGEKFEFVSDLLGVGGIGYAIGPGEYAEPRPWEHFLLPENLLRPRDGKLTLKMTEPMEEVEYLDSVEMTVYDLPPSWSMTLDERMGILGPQPTGKPLFFRKRITPLLAMNNRGEDVTKTILKNDLIAAPVGPLDRRFIGKLKNFHTLTLTFSEPLRSAGSIPVLVADGWVEYPYSQTSFAIWQAGEHYIAPSIEVRLPDGSWKLLLDQFGYPAGMPRQMAMPLNNLPEGVREIRIATNQEIYWDRFFIALSEPCPEARKQTLTLEKAVLEDIGFPLRSDFAQRRPFYEYAVRNTNWDSRLLEGNYTRLGDVFELVGRKDQALAILGPGEGVHLEFTPPAPPQPDGWQRRYVLSSYGWCKDMDLYTNTGETVGPLPGNPDKKDAARLHAKYNTRFQVGRR